MASILARNGPDQTIYADGNAKILIAQVLAEQPDALVEAGIELLRSMSRSSVKSMTETEFNSLLSAVAHRESIDCPGWRPKSHANGGEQEYEKLHRCLTDHNEGHAAHPAVHRLLNAFADQMAALIGEHLTLLEFQRALEQLRYRGRSPNRTPTACKLLFCSASLPPAIRRAGDCAASGAQRGSP